MNFIKKTSAILSTLLVLTASSFSVHADSVKGDANSDGWLTVRDAAFIAKCLAEKKGISSSADFNGDGKVTIRDAAAIARELSATISQPLSNEQIILNIVNAERAKVGVAPLVMNETMNQAAAKRAQEITVLFSHDRPDGSSCFTIFSEYNLSYSCGGENIAAGNSTPEATAQQWINSPGHYKNMIDSDFTEIGIGYASGSSYGHYWVQLFR